MARLDDKLEKQQEHSRVMFVLSKTMATISNSCFAVALLESFTEDNQSYYVLHSFCMATMQAKAQEDSKCGHSPHGQQAHMQTSS